MIQGSLPETDSAPVSKFHHLLQANRPIDPSKYSKVALYYAKALSASMIRPLESWLYHRKLQAYELPQPPLFVLGHWRSGTSFLQSLLGAAPGYRYYNKFQTFFPDTFLLTRKTLKPLINKLFLQLPVVRAWQNGISHDFESLDTASEIEIAILNQMNPHSFHWGQVFPNKWKYYYDRYLFMDGISQREYQAWCRNFAYLNKKTSFANPADRLIIKNPGDTARLRHILQLYPDAQFLFIHRDPYDVFYSNIKLWKKVLGNLAVQETNLSEIKDKVRYIYRRTHENYLRDRQLVPQENLMEISYQSLREDPLRTLESVFDQFNLPDFSEKRPHFQAYLDKLGGRATAYNYDPRDVEAINEEWSEILQAFGYPPKRVRSVPSSG